MDDSFNDYQEVAGPSTASLCSLSSLRLPSAHRTRNVPPKAIVLAHDPPGQSARRWTENIHLPSQLFRPECDVAAMWEPQTSQHRSIHFFTGNLIDEFQTILSPPSRANPPISALPVAQQVPLLHIPASCQSVGLMLNNLPVCKVGVISSFRYSGLGLGTRRHRSKRDSTRQSNSTNSSYLIS